MIYLILFLQISAGILAFCSGYIIGKSHGNIEALQWTKKNLGNLQSEFERDLEELRKNVNSLANKVPPP